MGARRAPQMRPVFFLDPVVFVTDDVCVFLSLVVTVVISRTANMASPEKKRTTHCRRPLCLFFFVRADIIVAMPHYRSSCDKRDRAELTS